MLSQDTIDYFAKLDIQVSLLDISDEKKRLVWGDDAICVTDALTHQVIFDITTEPDLWSALEQQAKTKMILETMFDRLYRLYKNETHQRVFEHAFSSRSWRALVMLQHYIFGNAEKEELSAHWKEMLVERYQSGKHFYFPFLKSDAKDRKVGSNNLELFEAYLSEKEQEQLKLSVPEAITPNKSGRL